MLKFIYCCLIYIKSNNHNFYMMSRESFIPVKLSLSFMVRLIECNEFVTFVA
jgi:hypothetical protein